MTLYDDTLCRYLAFIRFIVFNRRDWFLTNSFFKEENLIASRLATTTFIIIPFVIWTSLVKVIGKKECKNWQDLLRERFDQEHEEKIDLNYRHKFICSGIE